MEAWRLKMELWRVGRPMVAYSHHFDEEQDPEDPIKVKSWDPDQHSSPHSGALDSRGSQ
jgi:hypothetical protein